ncbi:enolase C-terminal domain-like protein [Paenibacillus sp. IITD108]
MTIKITLAKHAVMKEPLLMPFGFKGAYLSELWQSITLLSNEHNQTGIGVGVQSVLWSDASVFEQFGETAGNELMADMTRYALKQIEGNQYSTPFELLEETLPMVYQYGLNTLRLTDLRSTFALNALVAVDQAAWALFSRNSSSSFKELVPKYYQDALGEPQPALASIPLVPYGMPEEAIDRLLSAGYFLLKIKVGADPEQDGDLDKMLNWDCQRLSQIHSIASQYRTAHTADGKIAYYLDANGRYDSPDRLMKLLEHADRIGALPHIILFEEPFSEDQSWDVHHIPVRLAADESIHNEADAVNRIEQGYGALALKPVAKTMSMSLKIAKLARERNIPCFCADLTANPVLADWNKNLAAYLPLLPELKVGVIETNGYQNYREWERMKSWHPLAGSIWTEATNGLYHLDDQFYRTAGGALDIAEPYESLVRGKHEY